ncbi:MAG: hypothetical protein RIQ60_1681 [Pseudomonadota bacterium]|jgi:putative membrane protein
MLRLLTRWFCLAAALLFIAQVYPGVTITSFGSALVAAIVLGALNTVVRPLLVLLTLPATVLTLGLFLFVINAALFYGAAQLLDGLAVSSFGAALVASILYSVCGMIIEVAIGHLFRPVQGE